MNQIVSVTLFRYQGFRQKWRGLANMGIKPRQLKKVKGTQFTKLFGSGGADGFGLAPNFNVYGMLMVWDNRAAADAYFSSELFRKQRRESTEQWTVFFKAYRVLGTWDKQQPFELNSTGDAETPIVVITRASIKTKHVIKFWKKVPAISDFLQTQDASLFSVGVGEIPWFYQVTFSVWKSEAEMMDFAHKDKRHGEAARESLEKDWFQEYLFSRFHLVDSIGTWYGKEMLTEVLPIH
jgi:heme-degrading monooxygenase HmoA